MNKCFGLFKDKPRSSPSSSSSSKPKSKTKAPELRHRRDVITSSSSLASSEATTSSGGGAAKSTYSTTMSITEIYREREPDLRVFSLTELEEATNNFSRLLKLGEGGFGIVYKGSVKLEDGSGDSTTVAIKKLNTYGLQGHKQWVAEVKFLGVLNHPNLVKLLGYCSADGERGIQRLLVYEYMANKSLEDHLFNRDMPTISWINRLKIILGAAQGMAYLHEGVKVRDLQVIYRDFKTSNILLDEEFNPKLSDFGLAREGPSGELSHVSTAPVGTRGYAAPEYMALGHLTVKSDVWSFGVVLYEILTGRRTIERNLPTNEKKLLEWVKQFPHDCKRFGSIVDRRLRNNYSLNAARKIAKLADKCLSKNAKDRPSMSRVVEALKLVIEESEAEIASSRALRRRGDDDDRVLRQRAQTSHSRGKK